MGCGTVIGIEEWGLLRIMLPVFDEVLAFEKGLKSVF